MYLGLDKKYKLTIPLRKRGAYTPLKQVHSLHKDQSRQCRSSKGKVKPQTVPGWDYSLCTTFTTPHCKCFTQLQALPFTKLLSGNINSSSGTPSLGSGRERFTFKVGLHQPLTLSGPGEVHSHDIPQYLTASWQSPTSG